MKKHDEWLEQRWQATLIYSRAIKEMRALGLDKPAVVRLLRAAIDERGRSRRISLSC